VSPGYPYIEPVRIDVLGSPAVLTERGVRAVVLSPVGRPASLLQLVPELVAGQLKTTKIA
jgi:hypothetical protein